MRRSARFYSVYFTFIGALSALAIYLYLNPQLLDNPSNATISGSTKIMSGTTTIKIFDERSRELLESIRNKKMIDCTTDNYCINLHRKTTALSLFSMFSSFALLLIGVGYVLRQKLKEVIE